MRRALSLLLLLTLAGCKRSEPAAPQARKAATALPPVSVSIAYGSEKKTWLEEQISGFASGRPRTAAGKQIQIRGQAMGSGETVEEILAGTIRPHVFSPASGAYITVLNERWQSTAGHTRQLCPPGEPVVLSPLVIAMWKPMAEALGWPNKPLGWSDLLAVNANPKGWGAFDRPEWGSFKLGHTHPEFSNSGLLSVLAEAYAGAKKTRGLSAEDLDAKRTQNFIRAVEQTIVHYGKSTGFFADKMLERGPSYLSAAVLYENLVIESYAKNTSGTPVVAIYPVEGTFWSDHPYAVLDADWVGADEREAGNAFLAFLKGRSAQERALALGFRPADPNVHVGAPVDSQHGVDPKQPQTLLEVPSGEVLRKLLDLWKTVKRSTDVTVVFDKSGSMRGKPLAQAKAGAKSFLESLQDSDQVTLAFFDSELYPAIGPYLLGQSRADLLARIDGVSAAGGTALYDVVAQAYRDALERARKDPSRIHAVVVMTDGRDENSRMKFDQLVRQLSSEDAPVKVFTIAYGDTADTQILHRMAEASKGTSAKGTAETIVQVYQDMAAFF